MIRKDLEQFSSELRCSSCGNINIPLDEVKTGKKAVPNMLQTDGEAIALLCDDCKGRNAEPTLLMQYDANRIINHNVEIDRLEDLTKKVALNESVSISDALTTTKR